MFDSFIMQTTDIESINQLIQNIGLLVGSIAAVVTPFAIYVKKKVGSNNKHLAQVADFGIEAGQLGTAFAQKTAEAKDDIAALTEVLYQIAPGTTKDVLRQHRKDIDKMNQEVIVAYEQFKRLTQRFPEQAKANNIKDLPR